MDIKKPKLGQMFSPKTPSVFLAGSIDMGSAVDWQTKVQTELEHFPGTIFNPRRDDWDSGWKQEDSDPQFRYQVDWELDHIEASDLVFMFISKESKAPISLLEFGIITTQSPGKLVCCVEDGFYRRGNIEVVCRRNDIRLFSDFNVALGYLKIRLASMI